MSRKTLTKSRLRKIIREEISDIIKESAESRRVPHIDPARSSFNASGLNKKAMNVYFSKIADYLDEEVVNTFGIDWRDVELLEPKVDNKMGVQFRSDPPMYYLIYFGSEEFGVSLYKGTFRGGDVGEHLATWMYEKTSQYFAGHSLHDNPKKKVREAMKEFKKNILPEFIKVFKEAYEND